MLQKVRTFLTTIHNSLLEFSLVEQRILGIGLCTLGIVCLVWPQMVIAFVYLLGLLAFVATVYVFVVLKERQEQGV